MVTIRYWLLTAVLISVGFCFFAVNRSDPLTAYESSTLVVSIMAGTLSALALALGGLRSTSFLYITRSASLLLALALIATRPEVLVSVSCALVALVQFSLFSERIISRLVEDTGIANENIFILRSPYSIIGWFGFAWLVFWATVFEIIHLFIIDRGLLGSLSVIVAFVIIALFLPSQLRILLRRSVIVPHGIVVSDLISLTDVVLFPLAKIKEINLVPRPPLAHDTSFATPYTHGSVVVIRLSEVTDSLIVRDFVNETSRRSVNELTLNIADAQRFVSTFHTRFHHVEPQELTPSQEKLIEKELGIETAPRSDSKLPTWRKKKT